MPTYSGETATRTPTGQGGRAGVRAGLARPRPVAGLTRAATSQVRANPDASPRLVAAPNETRTPTATTILPAASDVRASRRQQNIDPQRIVEQALRGLGSGGGSAPSKGGSGKWGPRNILKIAAKYKGVPYLWGGTDPNKGLDCSGYTQRVFREAGINLPRVSRAQALVGRTIGSLAAAKAGDLIFYARNGRVHHVGIYAGNGMYWNAPHRGSSVRLAKVGRPSLIKRVL